MIINVGVGFHDGQISDVWQNCCHFWFQKMDSLFTDDLQVQESIVMDLHGHVA